MDYSSLSQVPSTSRAITINNSQEEEDDEEEEEIDVDGEDVTGNEETTPTKPAATFSASKTVVENNDDNVNNENNNDDDGEEIERSEGWYGRGPGGRKRTKAAEYRAAERKIMLALKDDVDALGKQFCADPSDLSLARFGRLFRAMDFSTIFFGRLTYADLVEFSENLFHYVGHYMFGALPNQQLPAYFKGEISQAKWAQIFVSPEERTNAERIFGIFLTYSLYFLQPLQFVMHVHVTIPQMDDLNEFMETVLLPDERFEPLYCIFRLVCANAFAIYPSDAAFNPLLHRQFKLRFEEDTLEAKVKKVENLLDFGRLRDLIYSSLFKQTESIHSLYMESKMSSRTGSSGQGILPQNALIQREGPRPLALRLLREAQKSLADTFAEYESIKNNGNNNSNSKNNLMASSDFGQPPKLKRPKRSTSVALSKSATSLKSPKSLAEKRLKKEPMATE